MQESTSSTPEKQPQKRQGMFGPMAALLVIVAALGVVQFMRSSPGGVAATPASFEVQSLQSAIDEAREDEKVVLAVATADWCAPCQAYKRGALSDPRVASWIDENAVAVMVDIEAYPDVANQLGVRGIPMTFLIHNGAVVGRYSGNGDAASLLEWLSEQMLALQ